MLSDSTHVSDNPTLDPTTNSASNDLNNGPEVCDPEDNEGSESGLEDEHEPASVQTSLNETSHLQKTDSSSAQEKKSYASIVGYNFFIQSSTLYFLPLVYLIKRNG